MEQANIEYLGPDHPDSIVEDNSMAKVCLNAIFPISVKKFFEVFVKDGAPFGKDVYFKIKGYFIRKIFRG